MSSYHGGKFRVGKKIAQVIVNESTKQSFDIKGYCEPFSGMLGVFRHIPDMFKNKGFDDLKYKAGDMNRSVMMMWNGSKTGWQPPTEMNEKTYNEIKNGPHSADKGYVCHQYSFGGKFCNSYIGKYGKNSNFPIVRERFKKIVDTIKTNKVSFKHGSYTQFSKLKGYVIYCDPPYIKTTQYGSTFDNQEFYNWCRKMSKHNLVFITEYNAPDDFKMIWSKTVKLGIWASKDKTKNASRIEKLFTIKKYFLGINKETMAKKKTKRKTQKTEVEVVPKQESDVEIVEDEPEVEVVPEVEVIPEVKPKKKKKKRAPSAYNLFCKKMMKTEDIRALPHKERFKAIGVLWREHKEKSKQ